MPRILIIEDDRAVRQLLKMLLERAGYTVAEAENGREGVHQFRIAPSDLVITDLIMPHKEGLETIVDMRNEFPDLKIIAISGGARSNADNYLRTAKLCGAERIFAKPFNNQELLDAVAELLHDRPA